MKYPAQNRPSMVLNCCNDKFIVDFACEIGAIRQSWHSQQSKSFYENLRERLITQYHDTQRGLNLVFAPNSAKAISWLAELIRVLEPGFLASRLVCDRLVQLEQSASQAGYADEDMQRETLYTQIAARMEQVENRLRTIDLLEYGRVHYEHIFQCWNRGSYFSFSPAGRCYAALQELYWGAFGEAILLCDRARKACLIEEVRARVIEQLAHDVNASPTTRHYYHPWFATPFSSSVLECKETIAWLGDASNIDQQPVSYSVTQAWRGIALGMPRICSAIRLGGALVDEIFLPDGWN